MTGAGDDTGRQAAVTSTSGEAGAAARRARDVSRWGPVVGFVLVSSANQMLWLNFAPITTGSASRLGVSSSTVGLLSEVFPLLYVVLAIPAGRALDRWFRPTLGFGALLTAGGAALRLAGHGFAPVLIGQLVIAVGQPAVLNAVTGIATRSLTEADRPAGIAVGSGGTFLGFVEAFVLGLVLGAGRLHLVLVVSAVYAGAGLVVLAAQMARPSVSDALRAPARVDTLHPPPGHLGALDHPGFPGAFDHPEHASPLDSPAAGGERAPETAGAAAPTLRQVWADPVVRTIAILVFVGFGVFVALTTWVQTLLSPAGVSARTADAMLVVMVVAGIVSSVAVPPLVARRRAQPLALGVAAGGGLIACLLLALAPGATSGYTALALFGLVLLPALPVLLELIETRNPTQAGTATALLWLAGNAGGIVVALLIQAVVGHPAVSFVVMAVIALLALPLARRLHTALHPN